MGKKNLKINSHFYGSGKKRNKEENKRKNEEYFKWITPTRINTSNRCNVSHRITVNTSILFLPDVQQWSITKRNGRPRRPGRHCFPTGVLPTFYRFKIQNKYVSCLLWCAFSRTVIKCKIDNDMRWLKQSTRRVRFYCYSFSFRIDCHQYYNTVLHSFSYLIWVESIKRILFQLEWAGRQIRRNE